MSPLLRCFAYYRRHLVLAAATAAIIAIVNVGNPINTWLLGHALDDVRRGVAVHRLADGSVDDSVAWRWGAIIAGFALARGVVQYLGTVLSTVLGQRLLAGMRERLLGRIQALDLGYHRRHGSGELISRSTRDSDSV